MALLTRISRLFVADAHAVLDHLEEPRAVLRQAMRDMAAELAAMEQRCRWLQDELRQGGQEEHHHQRALAQLNEELTLSLNAQREDLARQVLRRRLEREAVLQALHRRLDEARYQLEREQEQLSRCRRQLEEMQQRVAGYPDADDADLRHGGCGVETPVVSDEAVELALLRELRQRSGS